MIKVLCLYMHKVYSLYLASVVVPKISNKDLVFLVVQSR